MIEEFAVNTVVNLLATYIKDNLFVKSNKENALRTYAYFETLVYKLLERHLKLQSKQIIQYSNINSADSPIDFILPQGMFDAYNRFVKITKKRKGKISNGNCENY